MEDQETYFIHSFHKLYELSKVMSAHFQTHLIKFWCSSVAGDLFENLCISFVLYQNIITF
jgi:hypothetical protein